MKYENTIIVSVLIAFLFASFFLTGIGITGLYLMDFKQNYCSEDTDCSQDEVCCRFYNNLGGVCDLKEKCSAIYQLTMDLGDQTSMKKEETNFLTDLQQPRSLSFSIALVFAGLILLILIIIAFAHLHPKNRKQYENKKVIKKKSIKKKK